jgi:hypothetical protein
MQLRPAQTGGAEFVCLDERELRNLDYLGIGVFPQASPFLRVIEKRLICGARHRRSHGGDEWQPVPKVCGPSPPVSQ